MSGHDVLIREISVCIGFAWALGVVAQIARQPVILAYLAGGFLIGPAALAWVENPDSIATISALGLIFLLFMIGLEIDLKKILSAGKSILVTAGVQIGVGVAIGIIFFLLLGFSLGKAGNWDALYLGIGAALSSTVIIVKVLYEKRELDTLAGRITLGVLVLQDLAAILFLAIQPSLNNLNPLVLLLSLTRVAVLVSVSLLVSRYVLPAIFKSVARLPELVLVGALAWCFMVGEFASRLHLSREMGALVAGVSLSTFPYALDVTAKVTSLRDFFVTLFFVGLGMTIPMPTLSLAKWALIVSLFVVASRFITTFTPLYLMRSGLRMSFLPSLNLAQLSEFSLVVLALGAKEGHVSAEITGSVSLAFAALAAISSLAIAKSDSIVRGTIPLLKKAGLRDLDAGEHSPGEGHSHGGAHKVVLLGFFRTASSLVEELVRTHPELREEIAVVDFNPHVHAELKRRDIHVTYGDISQRETLAHAGIANAEVIVCTIPDSLLKGTTNEKLVRQVRALNPTAKILVSAEQLSEYVHLRLAGADYVSYGRLGEASDLTVAIRAALDSLLDEKRHALEVRLRERAEVMP
ncbi:MAG: cation:proton antiporter [Verrucomicrobia bacterium]|nr:cation:proton antiporter [Verrucomicrobiota bacterium]